MLICRKWDLAGTAYVEGAIRESNNFPIGQSVLCGLPPSAIGVASANATRCDYAGKPERFFDSVFFTCILPLFASGYAGRSASHAGPAAS